MQRTDDPKARLKTIFTNLYKYLDSDRKKPLMVYGPPQSRKKTIIRLALKKKGFLIKEPSAENLNVFSDSGLNGKIAFIMRVEEVKFKKPKNVKNAPLIYVCNTPYGLGMSKDVLNKAFQMMEMKTGYDDCPKGARKDTTHSIQTLIEKVRSSSFFLEKIKLLENSQDYLGVVIENSYLNGGRTEGESDEKMCERISRAADYITTWDIIDTPWEMKFQTDKDICSSLSMIAPIFYSRLNPKNLIYKNPEKKTTQSFPFYQKLFPKNSFLDEATRCETQPDTVVIEQKKRKSQPKERAPKKTAVPRKKQDTKKVFEKTDKEEIAF